jgi:CheY-like chemotaxis protein
LARKILLADDSVTAQNMGRRILTDAGYEVITVNNGSAALKKIAEQLPELIVLDVYMPGYSGLEVCQRLKETRETARIPVLLTVGKLEPFKPEDARKARADGFIIKPFEASELLTALTKLEDKIVPQPTAKSGGQFAKVWADLENGPAAKTEKFGDAETGWKDRLIIPAPGSKQEEPEPEDVSTKPKGKKDKDKKAAEIKTLEVKAEAPVSAVGVPADITAEEVAAIAAAAAAFEEKTQASAPVDFTVKPTEVPEEPAQPTATVKPDAVEAKPVEAQKETTPAPEAPVVMAEAPKVAEPVAEIKAPEPVAAAKEITSEVVVEEVKAAPVEVEPVAAISTPVVEKLAETVETVTAPVASVPTVPKWTAQEVPIPPAETGINLDQEMQKTNAVLQAATAGDFSPKAVVEPLPPAPPVEVVAEVPAPPVEIKVEEVAAAPAPEPERPQEPAAAVAQPEPQPEIATAVAAAASAGSSAPEVVSQPVAEVAPAKVSESELAAAWAQWKEIRETVVGSQLTSQIADVAAAGLKDAQPESSATEDEVSSAGNPTAIASIVDTVLAELKPKLMEEIARKMGDEKNKKKK